MPTRSRDVSETELALLKLLWEQGPSTIRDLTDRLYPEGGVAGYATVQKLLERLETKRAVRRARRERVNVYTATVGREELIARRLQATADQLCEGSLTPLLTHLVGSRALDREEIGALREWVERLEREGDSR
jgi:predicted transcriptional regulator